MLYLTMVVAMHSFFSFYINWLNVNKFIYVLLTFYILRVPSDTVKWMVEKLSIRSKKSSTLWNSFVHIVMQRNWNCFCCFFWLHWIVISSPHIGAVDLKKNEEQSLDNQIFRGRISGIKERQITKIHGNLCWVAFRVRQK